MIWGLELFAYSPLYRSKPTMEFQSYRSRLFLNNEWKNPEALVKVPFTRA
jgi:hypothetical protein